MADPKTVVVGTIQYQNRDGKWGAVVSESEWLQLHYTSERPPFLDALYAAQTKLAEVVGTVNGVDVTRGYEELPKLFQWAMEGANQKPQRTFMDEVDAVRRDRDG
jgi:hypothetical protein